MPKFEVEQYEIHTQLHCVDAVSEAEAIKRVCDGEGNAVDGGLEFIEVAEDLGLPREEYRALAEQLQAMGIALGEDIIPSVRSVRQLEWE